MNREIKFRGLRTDGKGWVYGVPFYIQGERKCFIITNCQSGNLTQEDSTFDGHEVKYKSVGQLHNSLTRKAGIEVYEGDKISFDLEAGLGEQKSYGHQQTIDTVEADYFFYSNVKVIGSIHTTHDKGKEETR